MLQSNEIASKKKKKKASRAIDQDAEEKGLMPVVI